MSWLNGKAVASNAPEDEPGKVQRTLPPAVEPVKALIVPDNKNGTTQELARFMPVMDIQQAVARRDVIVQAMKQLMVDGVDYGKIPNCGDKPALLQPGADKLCNLFGLTLRYSFLEKIEDWSGADHGGEPFFYYQVRAEVYRGEFLISEGVGACHSWESKYRWRKAERICPACGKENIRHSRDGGWFCWRRTEGCGATYDDGDPAIESQQTGRKPNPDVLDSVNTILKIAYKRCKIHGTINGTSCSEFFTQDVEDFTITEPGPIDIGNRPPNSREAQQYVAEQKIATGNLNPVRVAWKNMKEMADAFKSMREAVGETAWLEELGRYGWHSFQEMRNSIDAKQPNVREKVAECYRKLYARKEGK